MKGRIYEVQGRFYVRFGRDITRSFREKSHAERFLTGLRFKVDEGTFDRRDYAPGNPLGFDTLSQKWLKFKAKRIKPTSFAPLRNYMEQAMDEWGPVNIKTIQYGEVEDFIFKRDDISEKTRHNMVSCLNQFFGWVEKRHGVPSPEMPTVSFELGWRNIVDIDTQRAIIDEVKRISWGINPKIWTGIYWLSIYVAIRPGELINVREGQIDLGLGAIIIPHPKEKKPKIIRLAEDDIELIKSFPRGMPELYFFRHNKGMSGIKAGTKFGVHYLWKWWKKACKNLGVNGVDLYGGTRHSTATEMRKYFTPEQIKKNGTRHSSKAFDRYLQAQNEDALDMVRTMKGIKKAEQHPNNQNKVINLDK